MPLHTVEPRRLYRQIADQIRALIRGGEYGVGSRLPPERELAAALGVSRPSVREALIALEVEGLIDIRAGSGILVLQREALHNAVTLEPSAFGPFEIMQARQLVEGETAALAAALAGPAEVDGLRDALRAMEDDTAAGQMPIRGDRLFHLRVAEAAGNGPLVRVVTELFDERNKPLFAQMGHHFENQASWRQAIAEHLLVVEAIAAHDGAAARRAMGAHLLQSQARFAAAWPEPAAQPLAV